MSANCAEFHLIGNIVRVTPLSGVMKVVIASNLRVKKGDKWVDDPHFNTVNVWSKNTQEYITNDIHVGDLVRVTGRVRQSEYDDKHTGEKVYTVDLHGDDFSRLAKKKEQ